MVSQRRVEGGADRGAADEGEPQQTHVRPTDVLPIVETECWVPRQVQGVPGKKPELRVREARVGAVEHSWDNARPVEQLSPARAL